MEFNSDEIIEFAMEKARLERLVMALKFELGKITLEEYHEYMLEEKPLLPRRITLTSKVKPLNSNNIKPK